MLNDGGHMFLHYYYADPANYKCFSHISGTVSSKSNWHVVWLHSVAMFVRIVVTKRLCWKVIWVLLSGVSSTCMWSDHTTTFSNYRSTLPQSGVNNHNPTQLIYALNDQPISQFVQASDKRYLQWACMEVENILFCTTNDTKGRGPEKWGYWDMITKMTNQRQSPSNGCEQVGLVKRGPPMFSWWSHKMNI